MKTQVQIPDFFEKARHGGTGLYPRARVGHDDMGLHPPPPLYWDGVWWHRPAHHTPHAGAAETGRLWEFTDWPVQVQ